MRKKFNKAMAVGVLVITLVAWCVGMITFSFSDADVNLNFLLAALIYFDAALFASIFSGLVYEEK
jgi:hypothetical protein